MYSIHTSIGIGIDTDTDIDVSERHADGVVIARFR